MSYDVFISYASEDKEDLVAPLARLLQAFGLVVWYDETCLEAGGSLSRSIDKGLAESRFGLVVVSPHFLKKPWTEYELRGLVSGEILGSQSIIPIWHKVTKQQVHEFSPSLSDKVALDTSRLSISRIAAKVTAKSRPDLFKNIMSRLHYEQALKKAEKVWRDPKELKPAPIRHNKLPEALLVRIKMIYLVFVEVLSTSLDETVTNFCRDMDIKSEIELWEKMAVVYLDVSRERAFSLAQKREALGILLGVAGGYGDKVIQRAKSLGADALETLISSIRNAIPVLPEEVSSAEVGA